MSKITIRMKNDERILLKAQGNQLQEEENNYYVHPDLIDMSKFKVSDRIYNCPVKGICFWVDLKTDLGWINDICWVYPEPKKAYQHIAGWYGFYPSHKKYEIIEQP